MSYGFGKHDPSEQAKIRIRGLKRARELFRYVQPEDLILPQFRPPSAASSALNGGSKLATALSPFAQLAGLRCNSRTCLINVMDGDTMYFLAEATQSQPLSRRSSQSAQQLTEDSIFLDCSGVPLEGRICELTLGIDPKVSSYQFFVVNDLREDSRFADMEIVKGPPYYRFYAGTPLTTETGVNIGSLAVMDTRPRSHLTTAEEACLGTTASHIVSYLEINRRALEGAQGKLMSDALKKFADGARSFIDAADYKSPLKSKPASRYGMPAPDKIHTSSEDTDRQILEKDRGTPADNDARPGHAQPDPLESPHERPHSSPGKHRQEEERMETLARNVTFARAANLIRESLQLTRTDGVLFLSIGTGLLHAPRAQDPAVEVSLDPVKAASTGSTEPLAPVLAYSSNRAHSTTTASCVYAASPDVNEKSVLELSKRHPRGCIWLLDECGNLATPSDDGVEDDEYRDLEAPVVPSDSVLRLDRERDLLKSTFINAKQILFSPLWDASLGRFSSACFVWTSSATRIFDASKELGFLNTFGKTIVTECSRLDTELSNRQKNDFIGSMSHELRSPLHGILASVEFLAERPLDHFEKSLIDTISGCSNILLVTINNVLEYSKINSFELDRTGIPRQRARENKDESPSGIPQNASGYNVVPQLRLSGTTNVAALAEEVVDGVTLAQFYDSMPFLAHGATNRHSSFEAENARPEIILDVSYEDWIFNTQPGAVRRIIMNLVGNAIKYTTKGFIRIQLELADSDPHSDWRKAQTEKRLMRLTISDTGKGMSAKYLTNDLYVAFSQEDCLSPGTGLGLSIVRSIVSMLNGSIQIHSRRGIGTVVKVLLPLERPTADVKTSPEHSMSNMHRRASIQSERTLQQLRSERLVSGIAIYNSAGGPQDSLSKSALQRTLADWFQIQVLPEKELDKADIVLIEEAEIHQFHGFVQRNRTSTSQALLVLCNDSSGRGQAHAAASLNTESDIVEFISKPCGAYKMAKVLNRCIDRVDARKCLYAFGGDRTLLPIRAQNEFSSDNSQKSDRLVHDDDFATSQASQLGQMRSGESRQAVDNKSKIQTATRSPTKQRPTADRAFAAVPSQSEPRPLSPVRGSSDTLPIPPDNSPRILLVDDNKVNLRLLQTYCKQRRYRHVGSAGNGQICVDAVKAAHPPFDIILMDISMPVKNGFEATREIRDMEAKAPAQHNRAIIVMLTGLASGRDQAEGFAAGCDMYLTKPVSFQEVGGIIEGWEAKQAKQNARRSDQQSLTKER